MSDDRRIEEMLAARPLPPPPAGLEERVLQATTRRPRGWRRLAVIAPTTMAAVVVIAAAAVLAPSVQRFLARDRGLSQPLPAAGQPTARAGVGLAYDAGKRLVVMFGGADVAGGVTNATWTWDPSGWHAAHPGTSPSPRRDALMAYDETRAQVLLFGGIDSAGGALADTWVWDGSDWYQRTSPKAPAWAAGAAAMATDYNYRQVILVVPAPGASTLTTWKWDGFTWSALDRAAGTPPALGLSRMVATPPRVAPQPTAGSLLLYVASTGAPARTETWLWGNGGWRQASPAPPPSGDVSLVADPSAHREVAFDAQGSVWTWAGSGWSLRPAAGPHPSPCRCEVGDEAAGVVLHYDGSTWTWDGTAWRLR